MKKPETRWGPRSVLVSCFIRDWIFLWWSSESSLISQWNFVNSIQNLTYFYMINIPWFQQWMRSPALLVLALYTTMVSGSTVGQIWIRSQPTSSAFASTFPQLETDSYLAVDEFLSQNLAKQPLGEMSYHSC